MKKKYRSLSQVLLATLLCLSLSACIIRPYQYHLQQGNDITSEKIAQIEPGMSAASVRYLLGTPTLNDVFNPNRWDYIYIDKPDKGKKTQRYLTVYFEDDVVSRVRHD